jgi:V-type H+-transporting ATPase subunit C
MGWFTQATQLHTTRTEGGKARKQRHHHSKISSHMASTRYTLVSLPLSAFETADRSDATETLRSITGAGHHLTLFPVPEFKIGTLDALVQQADDLAKLDSTCQIVIAKVADSLRSALEGDEDRLSQYKMVNDKPTDQFVSTFAWNKMRYRSEKPLAELINNLQKELATTDNQVKAKFNQYQSVKTNLAALQRKQTGTLATKSLTTIVDPALLVQDSEYLETHLIVVPSNAKKDFIQSYETLSPMVVPRSAMEMARDSEFTLFAVSTFKKHSNAFLQKCREQKWTPRPFQYAEGGRELEQRELDRVVNEERKVGGEALRIGRTSWSESVMIWMHVLTLRVFVEAVLRYGLPLDYVSSLIQTTAKLSPKLKSDLDRSYSYLGGNAFGKDKAGNVAKDDASPTSDMAAAGLGAGDGPEYTAYVYYEFEFP